MVMGRNIIPVSYAHQAGSCGLAVSADGRYALTGAADCEVRAHDLRSEPGEPWWVTEPGNEPNVPEIPASKLHDLPITDVALHVDSKTFATASEDGFVRLFSASITPENLESSESLTVGSHLVQACARFGGPVRAVDFSPTGLFFAAAGDEPGVLKVIVTADPSTVNVLRTESEPAAQHPVKVLAFDPQADLVAAVSENGATVIWDVSGGKCIGAVALNDRVSRCLAWSPDGGMLVIGTDTGAVLVKRDVWSFDKLLQDAGGGDDDDDDIDDSPLDLEPGRTKTSVTAVCWSASGRYILVATGDATVRLWDVTSTKIISSWKTSEVVQCMRWHPKYNALVVVDDIGQFGIQTDVVPKHLPGHSENGGATVELPIIPSTSPRNKRKRSGKGEDGEGSGESSDSSSDDDDQGSSVKRPRKSSGNASRNEGSSGGENSSEEGTIRVQESGEERSEPPEINFDAEELDADVEEDAIERRHRRQERARMASSDEELERFRRKRKSKRQKSSSAKLPPEIMKMLKPAQESFVPSSTPLDTRSQSKKRILTWNLVAAVVFYEEDTHNIVEVEFADATRRTIGIKDHFGFRHGCVTNTGVLLASPKSKDQKSILSFRPFASWSNNSDWTQALSEGESAITIALAERFAVVATDQNTVRIFSLSGIQVDTFGMPGRVVTMATSKDRLILVHCTSDFSRLRYQLLEVASSGVISRMLASDELVLSPDSSLEWIGFTTDTNDVIVYDSSGTVWLQVYDRGGLRWLPMLRNAGKATDCEWLWIASASSESVIGAQCFSNERHPPAKPRPSLRTVPLYAPVVEPIGKNGQASIQERLFRSHMRLARAMKTRAQAEEMYDSGDEELEDAEDAANSTSLEVDKCILGFMEIACRQEQNLRAFDLATRLNSSVSFKYAINLANHYKRSALAGRVEGLARRRMFDVGKEAAVVSKTKDLPKVRTEAVSESLQEGGKSVDKGGSVGVESDDDDDSGTESDGSLAGQDRISKHLARQNGIDKTVVQGAKAVSQRDARLVGTQRSYGPFGKSQTRSVASKNTSKNDFGSKKPAARAVNKFAKRV